MQLPGQGRVLQDNTCLALLTILNFSPPPQVLEHSDQPVLEDPSAKQQMKMITCKLNISVNKVATKYF